MVIELIDLFLEEIPDQLADMQQAIAEQNSKTLTLAAHTLKSNSATLGAMTLSAICQELETAGHKAQVEIADEKITQFETEYQKVKVALEADPVSRL